MIASRRVGVDFARRTEREHRAAIEAIVPPEELMALARPSLRASLISLGLLWVELIALLVAANWIGLRATPIAIAGTVLVVLLIASRINAFGVIMHEASHGFLVANRPLNDRICNVAASWWLFHSVQEYRPAHRLHHRFLNQARDPDRISSQMPPTRHALAWLLLQDLSGISAYKKARVLWSAAEGDGSSEPSGPDVGNLIGKVVAQLLMLGQFLFFQGWVAGVACYVVYWVFPLLCLFPLIQRLKTLTEHFEPRLWDPEVEIWVARTSAAGWIQDRLVGAKMEYHFEHHVVPTIPFRGLRALHRRLDDADFFADHPAPARSKISSGGYVQYLAGPMPAARRAARENPAVVPAKDVAAPS
jgi:fatty acid desaturase